MARPRIATLTEKVCPDCKRLLPADAFGGNKNEWNGLANYCKECMRDRANAAYQKRKEEQSARRTELKARYVAQLGGKCSRCGYNEFISGLDFHHAGDDEKEQNIATLITKALFGNSKQSTQLEEEVAKCILLCRNCHMALHSGEWMLDGNSENIRRTGPRGPRTSH